MKRLLFAAFLAGSALPAQSFDLSEMTAQERAAFRAEVRAYLLENPEVIFEAVDIMEARQAEAQARQDVNLVSAHAADIFDDGYSWIGGNPVGDITLVEFVDYRCGYCRKAHEEVARLVEKDGNIRLVLKELPILGEASTMSSRFAIAVKQSAGDNAYKAAHDALISLRSDVNEVTLGRLASSLGLNAQEIFAQMNSEDVTQEIATTRQLAQRLRITGTPTFVMHDELLRGYMPLDVMEQLVGEKRG